MTSKVSTQSIALIYTYPLQSHAVQRAKLSVCEWPMSLA